MSKRKKLKKVNSKTSLPTTKLETVYGLNATCDAARNNKEQKHTPDGVCEQSTENYRVLGMKKSEKRVQNTKGATSQKVQDDSKVAGNAAIADNEKFAVNTSNSNCKDMQMQGKVSRAVANFDQNNNKAVKKVNKQNKIVRFKEKVQETGKVKGFHENLESNSDGASDFHLKDIQDSRRIPNCDNNVTGSNVMLSNFASCAENIKVREDLTDKKKTAEREDVASKKDLESCSTKKVGKKYP